jgi:autotransporter-associated beta strand protein
LSAAIAALFAVCIAPAQAVTLYWDGGTTDIDGNGDGASQGGIGTWDTTIKNWDAGVAPHVAWVNANNDTAVFGGGTAGAVTLGVGVQVGGLQFDTAGYVVAGNTLTFGAAGSVVTNADATISSVLAGNVLITKAGTGKLTLQTASTRTGATQIDAGILRIEQINAFGANSASITVNSGGTLEIGTTATVASGGAIALNDGGTISSGLAGAAARIDKTINVQASATAVVSFDSGANAANVLTINGGGNNRLAGGLAGAKIQIKGSGAVDVGDGTTTRTNAVIADWYLQGGALKIRADGELGNAANDVYFQGGTLSIGAAFTLVATRLLDLSDSSGGTVDTTGGNLTLGTAGQLTGANTLTKAGTNLLILSAANAGFTGEVNITGGGVRANDGTGLSASNLVTLSGGVLETGANIERAGGSSAGNMRITGGASGFSANGGAVQVAFGSIASPDSLTWDAGAFAPATFVLNASTANNTIDFKNPIDLGASVRTVQVDAAAAYPATMSGILSGTDGGITKAGVGTLVLSQANTFTGPTAVNAGTLQLTDANALAGSSGVAMLTGTALQLRGDNTATFNAPLVKVNTTGTSSATFDVNNNGSGSGNTLTLGGGLWSAQAHGNVTTFNITGGNNGYVLRIPTLTVERFGAGGTGGGLTLNPTTASVVVDAATASVSQTVVLTLGGTSTGNSMGAISNTGSNLSLTKSGASTWTLTGVNSYKGATAVSGGTLQLGVAGAIPSTSAVTVSAGTLDLADLDQTLSAATALTMGGTAGVTPAVTTGTGTLTLGGNVTYNAGSNGLGSTISGKLALGSANRTFTINNSTNAAEDMSVSAVISGTGVGLTKAGAGKLVLSGDNTYTGRTTMSAGILVLSGNNVAATGGVTINAGAVQFESPDAINGTGANVALIGGAVAFGPSFGDANIPTALSNRIVAGATGAIAADNYATMNFDFDALGLPGVSLGAAENATYTGTLAPSGTTYRLGGGGGTLTFTPASYVNTNDLVLFGNGNTGTVDFGGLAKTFDAITISGGTTQNGTLTAGSFRAETGTVRAVLAGAAVGLTKETTGTFTLNGAAANTYTGDTTVNRGTMIVDFANMAAPTDLIDSNSALVMGGGTLQVKQKSATVTSQTFNGTTINPGASTITATNVSGSSINTLTVGLGAIGQNVGGVVNFVLPTSGQGAITTSNGSDASGILGRWATTGLTTLLQYAANDGNGNVVAYTGATEATPADLSNMTSPSTNYSFAAGATMVGGSYLKGNTLRYTGAAAGTLEIGAASGTANTLTLNGLMQAGGNTLTIQESGAGATGGLVIGDANELVIVANNKGIAISAQIKDGSAPGSVTFASFGGGGLTLTGGNTYSGGTTVASGKVQANGTSGGGNDLALGSGPVTVMPGATLGLSRINLANDIYITDATIASSSGWAQEYIRGTVTLGGSVILDTGSQSGTIIYGNITGSGGLTVKDTRTDNVTTLTGTNDYTGPTRIEGITGFAKRVSFHNGDTNQWTAESLIVPSGSTAVFHVGGTGEFTSNDIQTLAALGSDTGGFASGSYICLNTASGGFTCDTFIGNPNGGANELGLAKYGGNTLTITGENTYSGQTQIYGGTISVSSFNSVATDPVLGTVHSASSNLGAPTTVAGGTIIMGRNFYGSDTKIIYTGAGETTDRVIAFFGGQKNRTETIDQSGTGLLKFTSNLNANGRDNWTLVLQGSTAGTGEFTGAVLDNPGTCNLTKNGTGTWTLSGDNTYIGATRVYDGTLVISGSPTGNSATTVYGGTLRLDYSTNDTGKIHDSAVLTLGGGTIELAGGTHPEIVASTTLAPGDSTVTRSSGSAVIDLNTITVNPGATISFGQSGIATTDNKNTNGILGLWAMIAGTDWAVNSTDANDGLITAYSGYTDIAARGPSTIADGPTTNVRIFSDGNSGNIELGSATTTVNTLMQRNGSYAATINTAGKVLASSGIAIASGGESLTIGAAANDGTLKAVTAGGSLLLLNNNPAKTFTVNAAIADNGSASSLGTVGNVTLNGNNTYTGTTGVGGSLTVTGVNTGNGNITIGTDSTLAVTGSGRLGSGTFNGTISIDTGGAFVYSSSAAQTLSGGISGGGGVTLNGPGTLTLTYANNFNGPTTVNGGTLVLTGELYSNVNGDNVTINGGTLTGTGRVGEPLFILGGARIAPGVSPVVGTMTVDLAVTMAADSIYEWEFDGEVGDKIAVNGDLTLDAGWKIALANIGAPGSKPQTGVQYDLFTYSGDFSGSLAAVIDTSAVPGWTVDGVGQDTTSGAGRIYLTFKLGGDTNNDGVIDLADYIAVKQNLGLTGGASPAQGNVDGDGDVDWDDLQIVMTNFGAGTSTTPATTPEPCSAMLLVLGAMAVVRRRARIGRISR